MTTTALSSCSRFATSAALLGLVSCTSSATPGAAPAASSAVLVSAGLPAAHVFRYELDLAITEHGATKHTTFSMPISDRATGAVTVGKNVAQRGGARASVGTTLTGTLSMVGESPRLQVDATLSTFDASGAIRKLTAQGAAAGAVGATVLIFEKTEDGVVYRLSATPALAPDLKSTAGGSSETHVVDIVATQASADSPANKTTSLSLVLVGEASATAKASETTPLVASDRENGASPRQDVGTRVKASALRHAGGLALDFDLELSAAERGDVAVAIRKLHAHGPVLAPFDRPTTAFVSEEDGVRYEVVVTPHRAK